MKPKAKKADQEEAISVCFFNNKGGVGKTTLIANLSAALKQYHNKKILLIDADPQCNLTQYLLGENAFLDLYQKENIENTIYSIIHPLSLGKGYQERLPIKEIESFGVDLIPGDPRLGLKEDLLAQDWRDARAGGARGLRTTFLFRDLIQKTKGYDFIMFDMGPSLGAINRSILMIANYFVVPMSIDIFSQLAIKNISEAITTWKKELQIGLNNIEDSASIEDFQTNGIKFGGYVIQQHKQKMEKGASRIVKAYQDINNKIPSLIGTFMSKLDGSMPTKPLLGEIQHLSSLVPKSQSLHQPMIDVTVRGSLSKLKIAAIKIFQDISKNFLSNIQ